MVSAGLSAFEALAEPTRRAILAYLALNGEASAGHIFGEIGQGSRTAISNHLRVLRSAGLITQRREGRFRMYALDPSPSDEVIEFLTDYKTQGNGSASPSAGKRRPQAK